MVTLMYSFIAVMVFSPLASAGLPAGLPAADGGASGESRALYAEAGVNLGSGTSSPQQEAEMTNASGKPVKVIFLHHSTGGCVWEGGVEKCVKDYNAAHGTSYSIVERAFPKEKPYGWNNYPYDYWNIWVNHAGPAPFKEEPTLEMLTKEYDVIVFKHCFPVANVKADTGKGDITSNVKSAENYKLQYEALKAKMRSFPSTKFVVWTGAMLVKGDTDEQSAKRAKAFFKWVRESWDEKGDNIFVWDFDAIETGGGLYLKDECAASADDSHPNDKLSKLAAPLFAKRVIDVIEGRGDSGKLTGE